MSPCALFSLCVACGPLTRCPPAFCVAAACGVLLLPLLLLLPRCLAASLPPLPLGLSAPLPVLPPILFLSGLDTINLSLDTLRPERFEALSRRPRATLPRILAAFDDAQREGYWDHPSKLKVNTVVMRGINDDEVHELAGIARGAAVEARFIE